MTKVITELQGPIAIVGGSGRLGSFFANLLKQDGYDVKAIEVQTSAEERKSILQSAKIVIISVPIVKTVAVIEEVLPLLNADALIADFTSIKGPALNAMICHPGEVLGLHPMFSPTMKELKGQTIVVCEGRVGEKGGQLCKLLEQWGAQLVRMSAEKHDKLMAVVQGMNHFHSIAFAHALKSLDITAEESMAVASPVYRLQMQLMGRILAQDPQLYIDIQLLNPHVMEALKAFQKSSENFLHSIERGSRGECQKFFQEAASALGEYSSIALKESDTLLARISQDKLK